MNWKDRCIDCKYYSTCERTEESCILTKDEWKKIPKEDDVDDKSE